MRRLAQGIVGAVAIAIMTVAQPWVRRTCDPATCFMGTDAAWYWTVFGTAVMMALFCTILTVVLVGVLGIRDSGRASEAAVLAALGQSQISAAKVSARRGATDGALVTGAAFVAGGVLHYVILLTSGWGFSNVEGALWLVRLVVAIGLTATLTLAHVIDAMRPRRTPVERLYEDAAAPRRRRISLAVRTAAFGGFAAACVGVLAGLAVAHDPANGDAGTAATLLSQAALAGLGMACLALFLTVGVPLILLAIAPGMGAAARATNALNGTRASAILRARSATASGASARTVLALSGLAVMAGALCVANPSPALSSAYVGTMIFQPADVGPEVAAEYAALPGVGKVVVGQQFGDSPNAVAVNVDEIAPVDPGLAAMLRAHPGAVVMATFSDESTLDYFAEQGLPVSGIVPTSTCCAAFVDESVPTGVATGAALAIYAAPGADPVTVAHAVFDFEPKSDNVQSWGGSIAHYTGGQTDPWGDVLMWVLVIVVCVGPVIALAAGVAGRRRRDDATLSALGASGRTLTGVAVVETTVIAALAVGGGMLGGAALQATLTTASRVRDSLDGLVTDSFLQVALRSVAWDALWWLFAGTVVAFAIVAWIVTTLGARPLPAEQLRAAESGAIL